MRHLKAFLLPLTVLALLTSCTHKVKEFWPDGLLKSEISVRGGSYEGPAAWYYESGNPQLICTYKNNLLDGTLIRFYENGKKREEFIYVNNKINGICTSWDRSGKMITETQYKDSVPDGFYKEYYPGGQVKTDGHYVRGLFDGTWFYYDEFGLIIGRGVFFSGSGIQTAYYPTEHVKQVTRYKDGRKEGDEEFFSPEGKRYETRTWSKGTLVQVRKANG